MPRKHVANAILLLTFLSGCSSSTLGGDGDGGGGGSAASGGAGGGPGGASGGGAGGGSGRGGAPAAGGGVGCNYQPSSPLYNCRATYAEQRQYVCTLTTPSWTTATAGACGGFDAVYTSPGNGQGRTCAYDQQGQLVWAEACGVASLLCGPDDCAASMGAPAPLPDCNIMQPLCPGADAGTD